MNDASATFRSRGIARFRCFWGAFLAESEDGATTQPGLRGSGGDAYGEDATGESAQREAPLGEAGSTDRLEELRRAFRDLLQRGDGAARHLHEADGEPALPQIHPRPLRRGGSAGMGGEPLLAVSLWDGVLLSRAACEPVEHEPLALPGWGGRGRGASEADDRGGIAYGRHQAQRAQTGEPRHHGAGEAHPLSDGPQALRPDARKARYGGPKGGPQAPAVIRAGWQAPARPAESLRPR